MHNVKKKGFTLIELIAVLVIMAIIALIATPLVMSIIRKARISADKRSIDAYGRSIELAIASYLLDTGKFPTDVSQLTIEYSGNKVECTTTHINSDSSVYLAGCTVDGRSVEDYTYGSDKVEYKEYAVGETISINDISFHVLKDSGKKESTVLLLKDTPLTTAEVDLYGGVGTENNVVNVYAVDDNDYPNILGRAYDYSGTGLMAYYENEECYYSGRGSTVSTSCSTDYSNSAVKKVVDAWALDKFSSNSIKDTRLITIDEFNDYAEYEEHDYCGGCGTKVEELIESKAWIGGGYFTMSPYNNSDSEIWVIGVNKPASTEVGSMTNAGYRSIRPVVELYKSALN